jgi:hypothetical protein
VTLASIQLAVASRRCLQPRELQQVATGCWGLRGHEDGWWHTLHFRPGSPQTHVAWNLDHTIRVDWKRDQIGITIQATSPNALAASLRLWVRAGATLRSANGEARVLKAGERLALDGGDLKLRGDNGGGLRLTGLPTPAHAMWIDSEPSIPTAIPRACACLSLGLRLPVRIPFAIYLEPDGDSA